MKLKIVIYSLLEILKESTLSGLKNYLLIKFLKKNKFKIFKKKDICYKNNGGTALIGIGEYVISTQLPILKKLGCSISGITSKTNKNNEIISRIYKVNKFSNIKSLIENSNLDSIIISTPPFMHPHNLLEVIDKNVYIYLEKPIAINYEGINLIQEKIVNHPNSKKVMIGFNRRYSESIKKLKSFNWINNRKKPMEISYRVNFGRIINNDTSDKNIGGGRLHGVCCHYVDLICYLIESEVKSVYALSIDKENINTFNATLEFFDHSIANLLFTSEGNRYFGKKENIYLTVDNHNARLIDFSNLVVDNLRYRYFRRNYGAFSTMKEFLNCKDQGNNAPINLLDGLNATKITLAIEESIRSKKIVYL